MTRCVETQMPLSICWFHKEVNLKNFATLRLTWRYSKQAAVAARNAHKEVCEDQSIFWRRPSVICVGQAARLEALLEMLTGDSWTVTVKQRFNPDQLLFLILHASAMAQKDKMRVYTFFVQFYLGRWVKQYVRLIRQSKNCNLAPGDFAWVCIPGSLFSHVESRHITSNV